jgi:predicted nucleic acid-binding protein
LIDPGILISADASAVINLNATGCAWDILRAIPNKVMVVDVVQRELEEGRPRGRRDADLLDELVSERLIEIGKLGDVGTLHFEKLVVGPAAMTLDDGEAATIAFAVVSGALAIVDERKAIRLCGKLFPELAVGCTVDILSHPNVHRSLGEQNLSEAVFRALYHGRMRVSPQHMEWVIGLIGSENAAKCCSLPNSIRALRQNIERSGSK